MDRPQVRASATQRLGIYLAVVEACLFALQSAFHFGVELHIGGLSFGTAFLYPAAILEAALGAILLVAVALPGAGGVRVGRVMTAQIIVILGVFVGQIALMRGLALATTHNEIFYLVTIILALTSLALVAGPALNLAKRSARR